jgi:hypothetical protein
MHYLPSQILAHQNSLNQRIEAQQLQEQLADDQQVSVPASQPLTLQQRL